MKDGVKHILRWVSVGVLVAAVGGFVLYNAAPSLIRNVLRHVFTSSLTTEGGAVPCKGNPGSRISLGNPFRGGRSPAEFTTDGSEVFIVASNFLHGGILDSKTGITEVYIGLSTKLPTYDAQHSTVSNTLISIFAKEDEYSRTTLAPGRYWLWSSNFADIDLVSCTPNGVSDSVPSQ